MTSQEYSEEEGQLQPEPETPPPAPRRRRKQKEATEPTDEQPKQKPKRKCTAKQLAALAAGRAKNKHFHPKQKEEANGAVHQHLQHFLDGSFIGYCVNIFFHNLTDFFVHFAFFFRIVFFHKPSTPSPDVPISKWFTYSIAYFRAKS